MIDFLLDNDDDLLIENGDFATGESDNQSVYLVIKSSYGDWRESPILGANLQGFINSKLSDLQLKNKLKLALKSDGWALKKHSIDKNGAISVTATKI
jgi:hypothetical protein